MKKRSRYPYSKKVKIADSKIHGFGVIAKRMIRRGEIVFIIKGKTRYWKVKDEKQALYGEHWIGIGRNTWIDPSGFGRFLNHSSKPNSGIKGSVTVRASKNIKKGEEITIDYSTTEEQTLWWMKDNTSKKQRVRSIQFLPLQKYKSYLPYVPLYFQKVYIKHHK